MHFAFSFFPKAIKVCMQSLLVNFGNLFQHCEHGVLGFEQIT